MTDQRAQFGSRLGFVLAAAGSAVGLGNIWKFPYIAGENGGGIFVLIYLICIAVVGVPILMAEVMIGRAAQKQPVSAFAVLQGRRTGWSVVGWLGVAAGFIILSYYIVVAGWAMDYTLKSIVNTTGPLHDTAEVEATNYRANTSIDAMRATLVERRVDRDAAPRIDGILRPLSPSVRETFDRFSAAMEQAPDRTAARARLLSDETTRTAVEAMEQIQPRIDAARAEAAEAAEAHYATMGDQQIAAEAGDLKRRTVIAAGVTDQFMALLTDGWTTTFWAGLFMLITIGIVARGISGGIERTCTILMPTLMGLMVVMVIYGAFQSGFGQAWNFVFAPDASKLEASGVLEALGHAFFTLSLGMGAMITYGSYQRTKTGLAKESLMIAGLDTMVALLACLMIFPIIFSYDQDPTGGPGLVFMSMPLAFSEIGAGGMLLAIIFFGLLVFAALTSAISLLEVVSSYLIDSRGWSRPRAAVTMGGLIFLLSLPTAFSADPDALMSGWTESFGLNFFDAMDVLSSNWMLPLGGLLISIYAGWIMPRRLQAHEVEDLSGTLFLGWLWLVRLVAPALVLVVLAQKIGLLDADELLHALLH